MRPIIAFSSSQRPGASARECFFSCRCARSASKHSFYAVPCVPASPRETSFCRCRFGTKKQKGGFRAEAQRRGEGQEICGRFAPKESNYRFFRSRLRTPVRPIIAFSSSQRPGASARECFFSCRCARSAPHYLAVPSVPASPRETSFCCCRFGTKKQKDIFRAEAQRRREGQEICGRFAPKESNYRFFRSRLRTPVRPIIAFSSSQRPCVSARECFFQLPLRAQRAPLSCSSQRPCVSVREILYA